MKTLVTSVGRNKGPLDLVFPNGAGNPESYQNILHRHWTPFCVGIGLSRISRVGGANHTAARYSLNCLRHGAVSIRIWQGWQPKQIQVFAGHSSIQVTMDIYGHLWRKEQQARSMAEAIEDELFRTASRFRSRSGEFARPSERGRRFRRRWPAQEEAEVSLRREAATAHKAGRRRPGSPTKLPPSCGRGSALP